MYIENHTVENCYQPSLQRLGYTLTESYYAEVLLRIVHKATKVFTQIQSLRGFSCNSGISTLSSEAKTSSELIAALGTFYLVQELTYPNCQGEYLLEKASWKKCASKVFLLSYTLLSDLQLANKYKIFQLGRIATVALGRIPILTGMTVSFYVLYHIFKAVDGKSQNKWFIVATSVGKATVSSLFLLLKALDIQKTPIIMTLTTISLGLDVSCMARKMDFI